MSAHDIDLEAAREELSAGIEQEFQLYSRGRRIDFRAVFPSVSEALGAVRFRDLDAAAVVEAGFMLACDGAEAEFATARVSLVGTGPIDLAREVVRCRESMLDALVAQRIDEVHGYSTHLNISCSHFGEFALAQTIAELVGPALTLLMEKRTSPGLLVRPRPTRLEVGTEYVDEDAPLVAGLVVLAGALSAIERDGAAVEAWPCARLLRWESGTLRGGIFLPHDAFGESLDRRWGRTALVLADGGTISAGELLEQSVEAAIGELGSSLHPACAEIARRHAAVAGETRPETEDASHIRRRVPPRQMPSSRLLVDIAAGRDSAARPLFVDWHGAVFAVPGTEFVAGIPWNDIASFLTSARTDLLEDFFAGAPVGGLLTHLGQLSSVGLYNEVDTAQLGREAYYDLGHPKRRRHKKGTHKKLHKEAPRHRIAVVGGGFAGLTAAWSLTNTGHDVTLFEATARIGGRVETDHNFIAGKTVEAGAELIGTNHPTWWNLAQTFGLTLTPITKDKDYEHANLKVRWRFGTTDLTDAQKHQIEQELEPKLNLIGAEAAPISATDPWDSPGAAAYDSMSVADRLSRNDMFGTTSSLARKYLEFTLGNNLCTPVARQSYLGLLSAVSAHRVVDDMLGYWNYTETHRCAGGNQQLAERLGATLTDLRLNSPVANLVVEDDGVRVGSESFDAVVLAAPPGTWPIVTSSPPFNPARYTMASGPAVKFLSRFNTRFWRSQGLAPSALWDELGMVWESTDKQPAGQGGFGLSVFSGGAYVHTAQEYAQGLKTIFPGYDRATTGSRLVDWPHRPWIMTGYSTPAPGQVTTVGKALATPFLDRLFFAGEQASPGFFGYMEGALESGLRAASQVEATVLTAAQAGGEKGEGPCECRVVAFNVPTRRSGCGFVPLPGGGRSLGEDFYMDIDFSNASPARCECCEYRQYIKGVFERWNPAQNKWIRLPLLLRYGVPISYSYAEDGFPNGDAYGHRPFNGCDDDFKDGTGASDRPHGCFYRGHDRPGFYNVVPGTRYRVDLIFKGQAVDLSGRVLRSNEWVVSCQDVA